jgi:hypothetical protein
MGKVKVKNQWFGMMMALLLLPATGLADSGFYIGASAGGANIEATLGDISLPGLPTSFDEDETAYKLFAGYMIDMPFFFLAAEGGYIDLGKPTIAGLDREVSFDFTGLNLWAIGGVELGPVDVFAKLGYIDWDVKTSGLGQSFKDNGWDPGYGVGLSIGLGPVSVRGEYEFYDLNNADISMLSVGVVYLFD